MQKETRPFIPWELVDDFMTAVFVKLDCRRKMLVFVQRF